MAQRLDVWTKEQTIDRVEVARNPGDRYDVEGCINSTFRTAPEGGVFRRGKQLFFSLLNNYGMHDPFYLICHNAMSGFWDTEDEPWTFDYVEGKRKSTESDVRVRIVLRSGRVLRFHDSRLFGRISIASGTRVGKIVFEDLGPEAIPTPRMFPGSPVFHILDSAVFLSAKKPIKQLLLEQGRIAGIGNIYAAEVLWLAAIHPERQGVSLKGAEHQSLTEAIQCVLTNALNRGLKYDEYLNVYRRETCPACDGPISKIEIAKRSTYLCVKCQR